mgnify:FL=1|tara:strand:+ start:136 stop:591 length:456 start_codon:yes stop_codon:yes gene_type:complete
MPANMKKAGMKYKMGGSRKKVMSKEKLGDTGYMYGGSMKKKMMHGGMPKKRMMKAGGNLKDVPSGNKGKGLSKLPTAVRNKMGYKQEGGMGGMKKMPGVPGMYAMGGMAKKEGMDVMMKGGTMNNPLLKAKKMKMGGMKKYMGGGMKRKMY